MERKHECQRGHGFEWRNITYPERSWMDHRPHRGRTNQHVFHFDLPWLRYVSDVFNVHNHLNSAEYTMFFDPQNKSSMMTNRKTFCERSACAVTQRDLDPCRDKHSTFQQKVDIYDRILSYLCVPLLDSGDDRAVGCRKRAIDPVGVRGVALKYRIWFTSGWPFLLAHGFLAGEDLQSRWADVRWTWVYDLGKCYRELQFYLGVQECLWDVWSAYRLLVVQKYLVCLMYFVIVLHDNSTTWALCVHWWTCPVFIALCVPVGPFVRIQLL